MWADGGCMYGTRSAGNTAEMRVFHVQVFTLKEAEKATNNFSDANIIDKGASAAIYRGALRDGTPVAIKILRANGRSAERAFRSEVHQLPPCALCCVFVKTYFRQAL